MFQKGLRIDMHTILEPYPCHYHHIAITGLCSVTFLSPSQPLNLVPPRFFIVYGMLSTPWNAHPTAPPTLSFYHTRVPYADLCVLSSLCGQHFYWLFTTYWQPSVFLFISWPRILICKTDRDQTDWDDDDFYLEHKWVVISLGRLRAWQKRW